MSLASESGEGDLLPAADNPQMTQKSGYDCRASGLLDISILAVISGELMTLRAGLACENQLVRRVADEPQDLQAAFWE